MPRTAATPSLRRKPRRREVRRDGFVDERGQSRVEAHCPLLAGAEPADRDRSFARLLLPGDEQDRNLGQRVFAHLVADLLVAKIALDLQAGLTRLGDDV